MDSVAARLLPDRCSSLEASGRLSRGRDGHGGYRAV